MSAEAGEALREMLGRASLFAGLSPLHRARVATIGTEETHKVGEVLFHEGEPGDRFFLILDGAVRIGRQIAGMGEEALAILRGGDCFGEMALVDEAPRSADARVHESCRLLVIRKEDMEDLMFVDRALAYEMLWNMVRILAKRLRETDDKLTFLAVSGKFG
jgi:CRP/FNR family transcriptional regulator, cyclic AMP receptor protein